MTLVYLGAGTNLGDRLANLQAAVDGLPPAVHLLRLSNVYETEPWGFSDQPAFLNLCLEGETDLAPSDLLHYLKELELHLGRQATFRYGPRRIDVDILFYGDQVVDLPMLSIPHPHLAERAFVLVPLAELCPQYSHPILHQTVEELRNAISAQGVRPYPAQLRLPTAARQAMQVPEDLSAALDAAPLAKAAFEALPPSHRWEYLDWIEAAARPATRQKRIQFTISMLTEGKQTK